MSALQVALGKIYNAKSRLFDGKYATFEINDYDAQYDRLDVDLTDIRDKSRQAFHLLVSPLPTRFSIYTVQVGSFLGHKAQMEIPGVHLLDFLLNARIRYEPGLNQIFLDYEAPKV